MPYKIIEDTSLYMSAMVSKLANNYLLEGTPAWYKSEDGGTYLFDTSDELSRNIESFYFENKLMTFIAVANPKPGTVLTKIEPVKEEVIESNNAIPAPPEITEPQESEEYKLISSIVTGALNDRLFKSYEVCVGLHNAEIEKFGKVINTSNLRYSWYMAVSPKDETYNKILAKPFIAATNNKYLENFIWLCPAIKKSGSEKFEAAEKVFYSYENKPSMFLAEVAKDINNFIVDQKETHAIAHWLNRKSEYYLVTIKDSDGDDYWILYCPIEDRDGNLKKAWRKDGYESRQIYPKADIPDDLLEAIRSVYPVAEVDSPERALFTSQSKSVVDSMLPVKVCNRLWIKWSSLIKEKPVYGYYQEEDGKTYSLYTVPLEQQECGLSDRRYEKKFVTYAFEKSMFPMLDIPNLYASYIEPKSLDSVNVIVDKILIEHFGEITVEEISLDLEQSVREHNDVSTVEIDDDGEIVYDDIDNDIVESRLIRDSQHKPIETSDFNPITIEEAKGYSEEVAQFLETEEEVSEDNEEENPIGFSDEVTEDVATEFEMDNEVIEGGDDDRDIMYMAAASENLRSNLILNEEFEDSIRSISLERFSGLFIDIINPRSNQIAGMSILTKISTAIELAKTKMKTGVYCPIIVTSNLESYDSVLKEVTSMGFTCFGGYNVFGNAVTQSDTKPSSLFYLLFWYNNSERPMLPSTHIIEPQYQYNFNYKDSQYPINLLTTDKYTMLVNKLIEPDSEVLFYGSITGEFQLATKNAGRSYVIIESNELRYEFAKLRIYEGLEIDQYKVDSTGQKTFF